MELNICAPLLVLSFLLGNAVVSIQEIRGWNPNGDPYSENKMLSLLQTRTRLGEPSEECNCDRVTSVPVHLHFIIRYEFYMKYTHAYGIPIISSRRVSDAAIKRACQVVQIMLADQHALRWYIYKSFGRVGIIGIDEDTTTLPEHRFLPQYYNLRARGLGATLSAPIATVGEENLLCELNDIYFGEDILVHEIAHSIFELALKREAIPGYLEKLELAYDVARKRKKWVRTYAASNIGDYFAEGVQSYFECNAESPKPDGVHNHVNTRRELKKYDPKLYTLLREVFPCGNKLKDRCSYETQKPFRMDCPPLVSPSKMELSYFISDDYKREIESAKEEPLLLIAEPPKRKYPLRRVETSVLKLDSQNSKQKKLTTKFETEKSSDIPVDYSKSTINHRISSLEKIKTERRKVKKAFVVTGQNVDTEDDKKIAKKLHSTPRNKTSFTKKGNEIVLDTRTSLERSGGQLVTIPTSKGRSLTKPTTQNLLRKQDYNSKNEVNNFVETDVHPQTMEKQNGGKDVCQDEGWHCNFYVTRNACNQNPSWMYKNCRKSCNLCHKKKPKICEDVDPSCYIWVLAGHCRPGTTSYKYMLKLCPKSCKFCN